MNRVPYITANKMDEIVSNVLSASGKPFLWEGRVVKTDIDAIIEFDYDLSIEWSNIDHLASNGEVLAAIAPRKRVIYMNENKSALFYKKMGTMNFSKAHELGHWVLHVTRQNSYDQLSFSDDEVYYCRNRLNRPPEERQADMFAASILMPKDMISGAIGFLKESKEIVFGDLYNMADAFEVTISALTIRLNELGLLFIQDKKIYANKEEAGGQLSLF